VGLHNPNQFIALGSASGAEGFKLSFTDHHLTASEEVLATQAGMGAVCDSELTIKGETHQSNLEDELSLCWEAGW
jgi:hypothetical protein